MRRAMALFVVAVGLLGCAVERPAGEPVPLLTSMAVTGQTGCFTFQITTCSYVNAEPT